MAREHFGHSVLFPVGEPLKKDIKDVLSESDTPNANSPEKVLAVIESARDWHVMSLADIHIVSSRSGFGVMGAMMRVRPESEYRLYNVRDERRLCNVTTPDPLIRYADEWSGL